jgi:hypothetical protein
MSVSCNNKDMMKAIDDMIAYAKEAYVGNGLAEKDAQKQAEIDVLPTLQESLVHIKDNKEVYDHAKKILNKHTNVNVDLNTKIESVLKELYPDIKLTYTTKDIKDSNGLLNQKEQGVVKYQLKMVEALNAISKNRKTIRLNDKNKPNIEKNIKKVLNCKGIDSNQVDIIFKYMKNNNIKEMDTQSLAERMMFDITKAIEIKKDNFDRKTYEDLKVPRGANYRELEISTPT